MFKMDCQNNIFRLQRMKNTQLKIKPIKTGRKIGTMYCLGRKYYTDNFKPQEAKMTKCLEKNQTMLFVDLLNQDF